MICTRWGTSSHKGVCQHRLSMVPAVSVRGPPNTVFPLLQTSVSPNLAIITGGCSFWRKSTTFSIRSPCSNRGRVAHQEGFAQLKLELPRKGTCRACERNYTSSYLLPSLLPLLPWLVHSHLYQLSFLPRLCYAALHSATVLLVSNGTLWLKYSCTAS